MDVDLPRTTREECSDSDKRSPWSHKMILTMDGGGIKGYSSLLILKRLMYLVALVEQGEVAALKPGDPRIKGHGDLVRSESRTYYTACESSEDYPWSGNGTKSAPGRAQVDFSVQNQLNVSVDHTFNEKLSSTSKFKPHHYFDYMAGTSTGGLSAIMLGRMELDVDSALRNYDIVGTEVFGHPRFLPKHIPATSFVGPKYASERMEKALKTVTAKALQEEIKQWKLTPDNVPFESDPGRCRTIAVAQGRELEKMARWWKPYLFRSYDHLHPSPFALREAQLRHRNPGHAHRTPVWRVARATSAAPTYFAEVGAEGHVFKDGGLGNNNPAQVAWDEVTQLHEHTPALLLSVGTGKTEAPSGKAEATQTEHGGGAGLARGPLKHLVGNIQLLALLEDIATRTEQVHDTMSDIVGAQSPGTTRYFRFNVAHGVGDAVKLDDWVPKESGARTKAIMERATKAYLSGREVNEQLLDCAREMVWTRRRRARTDRWESFACRVAYYCPERERGLEASWNGAGGGCSPGRTFLTRDDLRRHALEAHSFVHNVPVRTVSGRRTRQEPRTGADNSPSPRRAEQRPMHGETNNVDQTGSNDDDDNSSGSGSGLLPEEAVDAEPLFRHACYWDHCMLDVAVFAELDAYRRHLRRDHGIDRVRFESRRELERWLDEGRVSLADAFERRATQLEAREQREVEERERRLRGVEERKREERGQREMRDGERGGGKVEEEEEVDEGVGMVLNVPVLQMSITGSEGSASGRSVGGSESEASSSGMVGSR